MSDKTTLIIGVLAIGAIALFLILGGGGTFAPGGAGGAGPSPSASQSNLPAAYSSASGAGSLSVTELYAPSWQSEYQYSPEYKTSITQANQQPFAQGLFGTIISIFSKGGGGPTATGSGGQ